MKKIFLILFLVHTLSAALAAETRESFIRLPPGFRIELLAEVPGARSLAAGDSGTIFVGTRKAGKVFAFQVRDGKADNPKVMLEGLNQPNGVAWYKGDLYVAEVSRILRIRNAENRLNEEVRPEQVGGYFPPDPAHGWKFIKVGPDGRLYVPIGAPCNICLRTDPRYASITRMNLDGSHFEVFASGVRNTVGFDWHPGTGSLWFTDNGRDLLGDDTPPDELNHAPRAGLNFGFPFCHGRSVEDPQFGGARKCSEFEAPALELTAHAAALGMRFYTGRMFPEKYRGAVFIAEHGSWNRSEKTGYRVAAVIFKGGNPEAYEPFAEGWLDKGKVRGRPVDVEVLGDGSMLISDDEAGRVFRVSYGGSRLP